METTSSSSPSTPSPSSAPLSSIEGLFQVAMVYRDLFFGGRDDEDGSKQRELLHFIQTGHCRHAITNAVDGDMLADSFIIASEMNHANILQALLDNGMNVNIKSVNGDTALMTASFNGADVCVRLLLDHNASVDIQSTDDGWTALMYASRWGHLKIAELLVEKNANPDIQNEMKWTALMYASDRGHTKIVELLLMYNVDIDLKNCHGETALDVVENEEIEEMLRNHVNTIYVLK